MLTGLPGASRLGCIISQAPGLIIACLSSFKGPVSEPHLSVHGRPVGWARTLRCVTGPPCPRSLAPSIGGRPKGLGPWRALEHPSCFYSAEAWARAGPLVQELALQGWASPFPATVAESGPCHPLIEGPEFRTHGLDEDICLRLPSPTVSPSFIQDIGRLRDPLKRQGESYWKFLVPTAPCSVRQDVGSGSLFLGSDSPLDSHCAVV